MKHIIWGFSILALVAFGCGDDDDGGDDGDNGAAGESNVSGGSGTAAGATGLGGDPMTGNGGTGASAGGADNGNVMCDPAGDGACQNPDDCPAVESGEARMKAQTCGLQCLADEDPGMCSVACIVEDAGISADCATCYAASVGCAAENCLAQCGADPASDACNECQVEAGCRSDFNECSGLEG
jgi:hypothetical protein